MDSVRGQLALFPDLTPVAEQGDQDRATTLGSRIDELVAVGDGIATKLGLDECAKDVEPQG